MPNIVLTATVVAGLAALVAAPASAKVVAADSRGFTLHYDLLVPGTPAEAWARIGRIQDWWSKDHTYSGTAANLRLTLAPGGCFCEKFPGGGGVEHLRVTYADPGKRAVLTGALGPMLTQAVNASLDLHLKREGRSTHLSVDYRATGFASADGTAMALGVDQVLGEQFDRLAKAGR